VNQLELQFFWPLTEQIPLDLNYSECSKKYIIPLPGIGGSGGILPIGDYVTGANWAVSTTLNIEPNRMTVSLDKPVPWYRKILFKLLGIRVVEK
jgi:hypothetical protein